MRSRLAEAVMQKQNSLSRLEVNVGKGTSNGQTVHEQDEAACSLSMLEDEPQDKGLSGEDRVDVTYVSRLADFPG